MPKLYKRSEEALKRKSERDYKKRRTLKGRFIGLKARAKIRQIFVDLTFEDYRELVENRNCSYCGGVLPEVGHGLDRIDSSIGYIKSNLTPCCTVCNNVFMNSNKELMWNHLIKMVNKKIKENI